MMLVAWVIHLLRRVDVSVKFVPGVNWKLRITVVSSKFPNRFQNCTGRRKFAKVSLIKFLYFFLFLTIMYCHIFLVARKISPFTASERSRTHSVIAVLSFSFISAQSSSNYGLFLRIKWALCDPAVILLLQSAVPESLTFWQINWSLFGNF